MDRFWSGILLPQGAEESNEPKSECPHGKGSANPGEGSSVKRELSAELGHACSLLGESDPRVPCLLFHHPCLPFTKSSVPLIS